MKNVLITGANGFVGSHIIEAARDCPTHHWIAGCRSPDKLPQKVACEVRRGDLSRAVDRAHLLDGVDVVVHAAAWTSLWGNAADSRSRFYEPSRVLLEEAVASGVKRFVFLSSTSVASPQNRGNDGDVFQPPFWPHLAGVAKLEQRMRELASERTTMVSLRCGLFAGRRYNLGLLPILLPRLKTRLVPWVERGSTSMPIVSGQDIGQAFVRAATVEGLNGYEQFQIVGPAVPTAREVIDYLHREHGYPRPFFSVPFNIGYAFAHLMERLDSLVPWEPLVVRSIIHLLEETSPDNGPATERLGYRPTVHWTEAVAEQLAEMSVRQKRPMKMAVERA